LIALAGKFQLIIVLFQSTKAQIDAFYAFLKCFSDQPVLSIRGAARVAKLDAANLFAVLFQRNGHIPLFQHLRFLFKIQAQPDADLAGCRRCTRIRRINRRCRGRPHRARWGGG
jgi:hypothetical protein